MPTHLMDSFDCVAEVVYKPLGDKGEDALSYAFERKNVHTQAVFDGCGGAGAWPYPEFKNATGAFVSAQSMARLYLDWFTGLRDSDFDDPDSLVIGFRDVAWGRLSELKNSCSPMGISGSLVKAFPCTAAIAVMRANPDDTLELTAMWSGDSRVYFLGPTEGLIQVTRDDSRGYPDPMESLREGPPLSAVLNADKLFDINAVRFTLKQPCAIICASDGLFGYFRSPMDFEYTLLDCIEQSKSIHDFEDRFRNSVAKVTGDDSVCIASFYGWKRFDRIKKSLKARYSYLSGVIKEINARTDPAEAERIMNSIWEGYKKKTLYYEMYEMRVWRN